MSGRQFQLYPEEESLHRAAELRRELRSIAATLGWMPDDLESFVREIFGRALIGCTIDELDWLVLKFKATVRV